jgi:hypothetical protein
MESFQTYEVRHHLIHDGKPFRRGSRIALAKKDAQALLRKGIISAASALVVVQTAPVAVLSASTLGKLNVAELLEQAKAMGLSLAPDLTKDAILQAVVNEAEAAKAAPADGE